MAEQKTVRIVIAGGGTGGHLYPAIALAEEFERQSDAQILFIGTSYGLESKVLPGLPYKFKTIWMRGLHRNRIASNILFPARLMVSLIQCTAILMKFRPDAVVGTGGYVSAPALMIAMLLGIPTAIQEQNSFPGLVNRLLGNRVNQLHLTFEESSKHFAGQKQIRISGNPVRGKLNEVSREDGLAKFELSAGRVTLFVFGGSQGARAINDAVQASLQRLMKIENLQLLWATGAPDWQKIEAACREVGQRVSCHAYIDDMASAYAAADFVLCRAGATTLAEIAICGLPALLVPLPTAAAGHQDFNAKSVESAGAAVLLPQKELNEDKIVEIIEEWVSSPEKRASMSAAARKLARPNAAGDIVTEVLSLT